MYKTALISFIISVITILKNTSSGAHTYLERGNDKKHDFGYEYFQNIARTAKPQLAQNQKNYLLEMHQAKKRYNPKPTPTERPVPLENNNKNYFHSKPTPAERPVPLENNNKNYFQQAPQHKKPTVSQSFIKHYNLKTETAKPKLPNNLDKEYFQFLATEDPELLSNFIQNIKPESYLINNPQPTDDSEQEDDGYYYDEKPDHYYYIQKPEAQNSVDYTADLTYPKQLYSTNGKYQPYKVYEEYETTLNRNPFHISQLQVKNVATNLDKGKDQKSDVNLKNSKLSETSQNAFPKMTLKTLAKQNATTSRILPTVNPPRIKQTEATVANKAQEMLMQMPDNNVTEMTTKKETTTEATTTTTSKAKEMVKTQRRICFDITEEGVKPVYEY